MFTSIEHRDSEEDRMEADVPSRRARVQVLLKKTVVVAGFYAPVVSGLRPDQYVRNRPGPDNPSDEPGVGLSLDHSAVDGGDLHPGRGDLSRGPFFVLPELARNRVRDCLRHGSFVDGIRNLLGVAGIDGPPGVRGRDDG